MKGMSRRGFLISLGSIFMGSLVARCCAIRKYIGIPCDSFKEWKKVGKNWWRNRQTWREIERQAARDRGERPDVPLPRPYISMVRERPSRGYFFEQFRNMPLNQWSEIAFIVENQGNAPTWVCVAEAYEGPAYRYHLRYDGELRLTGRRIIVLQPGEKKEVLVPFQPTRATDGGIVVRCYDPIQDPGIPAYEQYFRQNSGVAWSRWTGG